MAEPTNNPFAIPDDSSVPEAAVPSAPIRDVLGGDEGKVVAPAGFVPDVPVSTPVAKIPPLETPTVVISPVIEPKTLEIPIAPALTAVTETPTAPVISVMPTEAEAKDIPITKPLREIPLQTIPTAAMPRAPKVAPSVSIDEPVVIPPAVEKASPASAAKQSAIRTLQSDIAHTVHKNQLSIAGIALAQKEKGRTVIEDAEEEGGKGRRIALILGSILLIIGGLGALAAAVYFMASPNTPFLTNEDIVDTIIPAEKAEMFDTSTSTRTAILQKIDSFMNDGNATPLEVRALLLTKASVGTTSVQEIIPFDAFFEAIGSRAPGRLVRTLGPEHMLGAIGNEPFLITPHSSYENAFAGLLEWEPLMEDDLSFIVRTPLEPVPPVVDVPIATTSSSTLDVLMATTSGTAPSIATTSPIATTTPPEIEPQPTFHTSTWKDIVVRNVDARALIRDDGEVLLLYTFLPDNLLLFVSRKETMSVILEILATPQFGQ
ncbi:MAG: hypothetical protein KBD16_00410 [Candidatus Pacebacteria bacterium]|nr:hypothetical protein [Candidatus Paceibacterota bacterium]